jgi:hypothetical protein
VQGPFPIFLIRVWVHRRHAQAWEEGVPSTTSAELFGNDHATHEFLSRGPTLGGVCVSILPALVSIAAQYDTVE